MNRRLMFLPALVGLILVGTLSFTIISADDSDTPGVVHPFTARVAQILEIDEILVNDAMKQARTELVKESIEAKLNGLVEEGTLTEEEATEKLNYLIENKDAIAKKAHHKMIGPRLKMAKKAHGKKLNHGDIEAKLKAAYENGDLTREEVGKKLRGIKEGKPIHSKSLEDIRAELEAAVDSGKITRQQADDRLDFIASKEKAGGHHKWGSAKKHGKMLPSIDLEKIKAAIENGDITRKEAMERRLRIR